MAEIVDPWILDPEGFYLRFAKTEGFWEGNSKILQLIKGHTQFFTDFEPKLVKIPAKLPLGIKTVHQNIKCLPRYTIKNRGIFDC